MKLRMINDVPVSILLSGGLDSSAIASIMTNAGGEGSESFTVRFKEAGYDEGEHAKASAAHFGLKHNEVFVNPNQLPGLIEEATRFHDEPLVHGHDMHILAISRLAKSKVTVLQSGEGADELFGGYVRHRLFLYPH